jgi:hypothetical protein
MLTLDNLFFILSFRTVKNISKVIDYYLTLVNTVVNQGENTMTYISNIENCHGDEHYLADQALHFLITDRVQKMLKDDSNYLLVAEAFEDLPDDIYEIFEDADLSPMLRFAALQNEAALGSYIFEVFLGTERNKVNEIIGKHALKAITRYFEDIAMNKLG